MVVDVCDIPSQTHCQYLSRVPGDTGQNWYRKGGGHSDISRYQCFSSDVGSKVHRHCIDVQWGPLSALRCFAQKAGLESLEAQETVDCGRHDSAEDVYVGVEVLYGGH